MMSRLQDAGKERFKRAVWSHLRQHHAAISKTRSDAELLRYIDSMLAFCRSVRVVQQPNVLRMINLQIAHSWAPPLPGYLAWRLNQSGFDEGVRVANFAYALEVPVQLEVISLGTPIPGLEILHG